MSYAIEYPTFADILTERIGLYNPCRMSPSSLMRLLITRQLSESIDGIQFSTFRPGYVYQLGPSVGNYLFAVGAAEPAADDQPYIVLSPEKQLFLPRPSPAPRLPKREPPSHHDERAVTADWAPRRPKRLRRLRVRLNARKVDLSDRVSALVEELGRIRRTLEGLQEAM